MLTMSSTAANMSEHGTLENTQVRNIQSVLRTNPEDGSPLQRSLDRGTKQNDELEAEQLHPSLCRASDSNVSNAQKLSQLQADVEQLVQGQVNLRKAHEELRRKYEEQQTVSKDLQLAIALDDENALNRLRRRTLWMMSRDKIATRCGYESWEKLTDSQSPDGLADFIITTLDQRNPRPNLSRSAIEALCSTSGGIWDLV